MKRNKFFIALCSFLLIVCLCSCSAKTSNNSKSYKVVVDSIGTTISNEDKKLIESEAEAALKNIPKYLGIKNLNEKLNGRDIYITVKDDIDVSYADSTYIYLSKEFVDIKKPPVVHEMAHTLTYLDPSANIGYKFVSEGIAQLMQELYGIKGTLILGKELVNREDYSEILNEIKNENDFMPISDLIQHSNYYSPDRASAMDRATIIRRKAAYAESTSFFLFLNDKYGEKKVRELYHSAEETNFEEMCKKVFKKSVSELEKEWRDYYKF